jgi:hypothetical protein
VADDVDRGLERLDHLEQVARQRRQRVRRLVVRARGLVLPALVVGDHRPAVVRQRLEDGDEVLLGAGEPRHQDDGAAVRRAVLGIDAPAHERAVGGRELDPAGAVRQVEERRRAHGRQTTSRGCIRTAGHGHGLATTEVLP